MTEILRGLAQRASRPRRAHGPRPGRRATRRRSGRGRGRARTSRCSRSRIPTRSGPLRVARTFRLLVDAAHETIVISPKEPATKQAAGIAIGKRNAWLIAHADAAVVVWDGTDRTLRDDVRALERRIPDDVWVVAPEAG